MSELNENQPQQKTEWEREMLARLSFAALNEQRRARRWNIFFKLALLGYLTLILFLLIPKGDGETGAKKGPHTAVVKVEGLIDDGAEANAENIIEGLRAAFENKRTQGVILRINSPGGSPVQSDYVYAEIRRLREKHPDIPVHAVIVDMGASGAYYIAAAADEIYVNPASVVGSIGVLMNGFGFVDAMDKLGIERRLLTAGEHKGILDPFSPVNDGDVQHIRGMLGTIHEQFIEAVKQGRGERLKNSPELFSGLFWNGREALELGLVDGFGDVDHVAREVIGAQEIVDYSRTPDLFERFAERLGASIGNVMVKHLGLQPGALR